MPFHHRAARLIHRQGTGPHSSTAADFGERTAPCYGAASPDTTTTPPIPPPAPPPSVSPAPLKSPGIGILSAAQQLAARGLACAVTHQRSLADPRLTPDDEHRTLTATNTVQQAVKDLAFPSTPPEGRRSGYGHSVTIGPYPGQGNTLARSGVTPPRLVP